MLSQLMATRLTGRMLTFSRSHFSRGAFISLYSLAVPAPGPEGELEMRANLCSSFKHYYGDAMHQGSWKQMVPLSAQKPAAKGFTSLIYQPADLLSVHAARNTCTAGPAEYKETKTWETGHLQLGSPA